MVPLCTPGIVGGKHLDGALGMYEAGDGRLIADLVDAEGAKNCLKATSGNLNLNIDGVQLNLSGTVNYQSIAGPQRRIVAATLNPALCESYFNSANQFALLLSNANGDLQGTNGSLGGVVSLRYTPGTGAFTPTLGAAQFGPWLTCYDATLANAPIVSSQDSVFDASFESDGDLRVEYLDTQGVPIESTLQTIGSNVVYKVRVSNQGELAASGVRVREFVPKVGRVLAPAMEMVSCVRDSDAQSCADTDGALRQDIATLAPGAAHTYTLTRKVIGSTPIAVESGALTSVAAFSNPDAVAEGEKSDNSRHLRIGLQTLPQFTVSASAPGGGGTISPASQSITQGNQAQFTLNPATGFGISAVADNCGSGGASAGSLAGAVYTIPNITAACSATATFTLLQYAVSATGSGANGSISVDTPSVSHGGTANFTVAPAVGYTVAVAGTAGCGTVNAPATGGAGTAGPITAACTLSATFSQNQYTVTPVVSGGNGSISPSTPQVRAHGDNLFFTLTPAANYQIATVIGCGGSLSGNNYLISSVTSSCTVTATFSLITYPVTAASATNGTAAVVASPVAHGGTAQFTVTPNTGYHTTAVNFTAACGTPVDNGGGSWSAGPIVAAGCEISATFAINEYNASITVSGANGTAGPASQIVQHGSAATFTVTPNTGFTATVVGDTCTASNNGDGTWTTSALTGPCALTASFATSVYTVTGAVSSGAATGTITASRQVEHGDFGLFILTPAADHHFDSISDTCGGGSLNGANTQYTVGPVTAACTVTVVYAPNP